MWVVVHIFAILLILLGGGYTVIYLNIGLTESDNSLSALLPLWLRLGLAPLALGALLLWVALRMRKKRMEGPR